MADGDHALQPPDRLRRLASWQASKVSTLGARLTAPRMPLGARTDFAVLAALEATGLNRAGKRQTGPLYSEARNQRWSNSR